MFVLRDINKLSLFLCTFSEKENFQYPPVIAWASWFAIFLTWILLVGNETGFEFSITKNFCNWHFCGPKIGLSTCQRYRHCHMSVDAYRDFWRKSFFFAAQVNYEDGTWEKMNPLWIYDGMCLCQCHSLMYWIWIFCQNQLISSIFSCS